MDTQAEFIPISSLTLATGDMLELDIGATTWTVADSSTIHFQKKAVCIEAATSTATEVKAILVNDYQMWEVDLTNAGSDNHDGDRMVLTDQNDVNNTGTDSTAQTAVFIQFQRVGETSDNTAIGWFIAGTGIDPDAS